jgi:tetratricopeptide (TPR) repeat protein
VLEETDLGLQYGNEERIASAFKQDRDKLGDVVLKSFAGEAERSRSKADYNRLGMLSARFGRLKEAEDAFGKALKIDAKYANALVNLGNVHYLRKDYRKAIDTYRSVIPLLGKPDRGSFAANVSIVLLVNMAQAYSSLGNAGEARSVLAQAAQIDPERAQALASLTPVDPGTSRAADAGAAGRVSFLEEEQK